MSEQQQVVIPAPLYGHGSWVKPRSGGAAGEVTARYPVATGWEYAVRGMMGMLSESALLPAEPPSLTAVLADLSERWVMSPAEEQAYERDRMQRERRLNLAKMAEVITDADLERIVSDQVDTYASKVIRRFLATAAKPGGPRFCWLSGATGRGKTVAACLGIAIERGRYVTAENLCLAYSSKSLEAAAMREYVKHCRLLVVDDVGTEKDHEAMKHALQQLLNDRQGKGRLTILTGNGSRDEVRAWLDPRTLERIEHQGGIVECKGDNLRRKGAA